MKESIIKSRKKVISKMEKRKKSISVNSMQGRGIGGKLRTELNTFK